MLDHLNSREFEEYCQLLLTCHYRCKVILTKQTGDEGRDLLVYHSSGLAVVECKHWPNGTVGRPVVQKLHSAILTANSTRGSIITTGRFSNEASSYALGRAAMPGSESVPERQALSWSRNALRLLSKASWRKGWPKRA